VFVNFIFLTKGGMKKGEEDFSFFSFKTKNKEGRKT
jgi:hypothetical protein